VNPSVQGLTLSAWAGADGAAAGTEARAAGAEAVTAVGLEAWGGITGIGGLRSHKNQAAIKPPTNAPAPTAQ